MGLRITGTIYSKQGDAHKNHPVLIPLIAKYFPEIKNCSKFGTINIRLDRPVDKVLADFWTPRIRWRPCWLKQNEIDSEEAFGFNRLRFEFPLEGHAYPGWMMLPEGAPSAYNDRIVEIIVDVLIAHIKSGARCAICFDHKPAMVRPAWFGHGWQFGHPLK